MVKGVLESPGGIGGGEVMILESRPTSVIIDTEALKYNFLELKKRVGESTGIMAVVKANAYGHGDVEVARVLEGLGCAFFGVAIAEEGARLRTGGILSPVIVLGGVYPGQVKEFFDLDLTPVVFDIDTVRLLDEYAAAMGVTRKVHVKIDTGMGRLGLMPSEVEPFFSALKGLGNIEVEAVLSHFAEAELEDKDFSIGQMGLFTGLLEKIRSMGFSPAYTDMANSAAALDLPDSRFNLVRPGIMVYGSYPAPRFRERIALKPAMKISTRILAIKKVPSGTPISYGRRFVTERESLIAVLPIGYGDGLPRRLTGKGEALVRGRRAPIAGTVCMDLTMCDVTDVPGVRAGDEAVILGAQGTEVITVEEIAEKAGTISYEIFCNISQRVPRVYV